MRSRRVYLLQWWMKHQCRPVVVRIGSGWQMAKWWRSSLSSSTAAEDNDSLTGMTDIPTRTMEGQVSSVGVTLDVVASVILHKPVLWSSLPWQARMCLLSQRTLDNNDKVSFQESLRGRWITMIKFRSKNWRAKSFALQKDLIRSVIFNKERTQGDLGLPRERVRSE